MAEYGVIFTDEMVRAIEDGRKTETRRLVKIPQNCANSVVKQVGGNRKWVDSYGVDKVHHARVSAGHYNVWSDLIRPPYGVPGDVLWIKQGVWSYELLPVGKNGQMKWPKFKTKEAAQNFMDGSCVYTSKFQHHWPADGDGGLLNKMFMPRWCSRLDLRVVGVSVERLLDINEAGAMAEGMRGIIGVPPRMCFKYLWDELHTKPLTRWENNPWVWVYKFELMEGNK